MQPRHYLKSINHFKSQRVLVGLEGLLSYSSLPWNSRKNVSYWIDLSDCPGPFCKNLSVGLPQWTVLGDPCQHSSYKKTCPFFVYYSSCQNCCVIYFPSLNNTYCYLCFFYSSNEPTWSNEGCVRSDGNMTYSVCLCNHLTNFAILMQVVPLKVRNQHRVLPPNDIRYVTIGGAFVVYRTLAYNRATVDVTSSTCEKNIQLMATFYSESWACPSLCVFVTY